MNSYWLVICVFVIGFGWGAAAMLCWIAVKDEYALRIEWYRKGGLIEHDE